MNDDTYSVGQVGDMMGISAPSVRRWAMEFAAHLDEGARPERGVHRRFSRDDLRVLLYAKRRLEIGVSAAAVRQELRTAALPSWADVLQQAGMVSDDTPAVGLTTPAQHLLESLVASQARIADVVSQVADVATLRADVDLLRRELDEMRRELDQLRTNSHKHRRDLRYTPEYDTNQQG